MGAYLDKPETSKEWEEGLGDNDLPVGVCDMQGWRKTMEDAYILQPRLCNFESNQVHVYAVFDGHGGREVSKFCAKYFGAELAVALENEKIPLKDMLVKTFHRMDDMLRSKEYASEVLALQVGSEEAKNGISSDEIGAQVKQKMDQADEKGTLSKEEAVSLLQMMQTWKQLQVSEETATNAGCTANVCIHVGNKLYCANAGDSRAVLCSKGGAIPLSFDHKPTQQREEKRIIDAGGYVNGVGRVCDNLNLSRAIGDLKYKTNASKGPEAQIITAEPDISITDLDDKSEFVVIACDGVYDVMSNDELVKYIRDKLKSRKQLKEIAEQLLDDCLCENPSTSQGIGADNMTCMIILLKPYSHFK